jgi:hypothetical protein
MAVPAQQLQTQLLLNYCIGQMHMGAFILGASNAQAAQGGNLAFIEVKRNGQTLLIKHAFSNSSSLPQAVRTDFAPSVPQAHLGMVGIANGSQHANHTEPKLFDYFRSNLHSFNGSFDEIIIASQLDCCTSCVKNTINAITTLLTLTDMGSTTQVRFFVVEINSGRVREGYEL